MRSFARPSGLVPSWRAGTADQPKLRSRTSLSTLHRMKKKSVSLDTPEPASHVTVFVGLSVDGFIARPDGGLDWLPNSGAGDEMAEGEDHGYEALMDRTDALVMGRATYDKVLEFDVPWPYEKPVFVLTHREIKVIPEGADVEAIEGDPFSVIGVLARRKFKHLYIDGGQVVQEWLAAGAVDELILTRVPVLIGEGIPLFGPVLDDIRLEHVATQVFPGHLVQSKYNVK
jgi:dihydrofolate reductase